jgi:hypothetical protein
MKHPSTSGIYEPGLFEPVLIGWRRKWIDLVEVATERADRMIIEHHYSHKATSNRFLSMGVFSSQYGGGKMLGVIQLGYGIKPQQKYTWGEDVTGENACEFDRMWLDDALPKFSETIVLSCLDHYLRVKYPSIKYLISYADGSTGRTGTIYKAANYKSLGSIKADFYILPSGERVHPVTMWHRHGTREWKTLQTIYPGIKKAEGRQYRFIRQLHA